MAWRVSYPIWNALPQWSASHAYTLGQIIRPLTDGGTNNRCAYKCTTAGTSGGSEPSFNTNNNATTSDGGTLVWTNVTGQDATNWTAPAGSIGTISSGAVITQRLSTNDQIFVDHSHTETGATSDLWAYLNRSIVLYSVSTSDNSYLAGASVTFASGQRQDVTGPVASYGISYYCIAAPSFAFSMDGNYLIKFADCTLGNTTDITSALVWNGNPYVRLSNVSLQFTAGTAYALNLTNAAGAVEWRNNTTAPFVGGTNPTYLLAEGSNVCAPVVFEGLDLSSYTFTALIHQTNNPIWPIYFNSCALPTAAVPYFDGSSAGVGAQLQFYNCANTNINYGHEFHASNLGDMTTTQATYFSGGSTDGVNPFSHKMVSSASVGPVDLGNTLDGADLEADCRTPGTALTARIDFVSNINGLTSGDVFLDIFYPSSSSKSKGSIISSKTPNASTALAAGTSTWVNPPSPAFYYSISLTFTPQAVGKVRGRLRLQRASTTLYYNAKLSGVS